MAANDPFSKVTVGDPFRFKAAVHNAIIDLIMERKIPGMAGAAKLIPGYPENETSILIRNKTGANLPQFGVVAINTPSILQSANDKAFRSRHFWDGDTPSSTSVVAVTQQPICKGDTGSETTGRIGPAIVLGETAAKVNVTNAAHKYCVPSTSTSTLDSATTGPIKLLWYDTSGGSTGNDKWARVLLLGDAPGTGGSAPAFSGVRVAHSVSTLSVNGSSTISFTSSSVTLHQQFDTDGYHSTSVNPTRLTAPSDGYYACGGFIVYGFPPTDAELGIYIQATVTSGSTQLEVAKGKYHARAAAAGAGTAIATCSGLVYLLTGEYVEMSYLTTVLTPSTVNIDEADFWMWKAG